MAGRAETARGAELAAHLERAADAFIALVERVDAERWAAVPDPGVWSVGKDAAHVAEAAVLHQWIVRRTIGEAVTARRPAVERSRLTTPYSPADMAAILRKRADEGANLLRGLADDQLELPTRPPRANGERLARTIERVLIHHFETHHTEIERKLRRMSGAR